MTIDRTIGADGAIYDKISTTAEENAAIDRCHEILRKRYEERGGSYTQEQREMCEWWLQGLLRFEGVERMTDMAQNAEFRCERKLITIGYAEI